MRCHPTRWLWGLIPIAMLSWLAVHLETDFIQRDLETRSAAALRGAGLDWASVAFSGRDGLLVGQAAAPAQLDEAAALVRNVWGVRTVETRVALAAEIDLPVATAADDIVPDGTIDDIAPHTLYGRPAGEPLLALAPSEYASANDGTGTATTSSRVRRPRHSRQCRRRSHLKHRRRRFLRTRPHRSPKPRRLPIPRQWPPSKSPPGGRGARDGDDSRSGCRAARAEGRPDYPGRPGAACTTIQNSKRRRSCRRSLSANLQRRRPSWRRPTPTPAMPQHKPEPLRPDVAHAPVAAAPPMPEHAPRFETAALPPGNISSDGDCLTGVRGAAQQVEVHFGHGRAMLDTAGKALIDRLIGALNICPEAKISVSGHADASGLSRRNLALSKHRARAVANYMTAEGH